MDPLTRHVIERADVRAGEAVLDVGCGCGATSRAMADAGARMLGIDVSVPMLERAREQAREINSLEFVEADAASHAFDAEFDLLFSRFGVMFFSDPVGAFTNLRGALSSTGRLCFICWQSLRDNPWLATPLKAAQPFLPGVEAPDPRAPGPHALADADYLRDVLGGAGFSDVSAEAYSVQMRIGADLDDAMVFLTQVGPLARALDTVGTAERSSAIEAVRQAMAVNETPDGVVLPGACWIATASR